MTKAEMKNIVNQAIKDKNLCRMYFKYHANYWYYFPLASSEKLFLGTEENDFLIDGYTIRRYTDLKKIQIKNDLCNLILKNEGIIDGIQIPNIDILNWETVFRSLKRTNKNIIVERESINKKNNIFLIGRIDKVFKEFTYFYHFDADGVWDIDPYKIPYTEITSISFDTRYIKFYSKYLEELKLETK
jgi:pyruvate/2-oxoglutarate/acetoin dehydrogenase E1 component